MLIRGFTLVEMLVVLAVLGVLLAIGIPGYQGWLANHYVRTSARELFAGLVLARSEAVRRNSPVEFVLTNSAPIAQSVSSASPDAGGSAFIVREAAAGGYVFIRGATSSTGRVSVSASSPIARFTGLGTMASPAFLSIDVTHPSSSQPARIVAFSGGMIRLCNPSAKAGDPAAC